MNELKLALGAYKRACAELNITRNAFDKGAVQKAMALRTARALAVMKLAAKAGLKTALSAQKKMAYISQDMEVWDGHNYGPNAQWAYVLVRETAKFGWGNEEVVKSFVRTFKNLKGSNLLRDWIPYNPEPGTRFDDNVFVRDGERWEIVGPFQTREQAKIALQEALNGRS